MKKPPLKFLHSAESIIRLKIEQYGKLSTDDLLASLLPGQDGALKTWSDGTVCDGHHRLIILRERGIEIDDLPREVIEKDSSTM